MNVTLSVEEESETGTSRGIVLTELLNRMSEDEFFAFCQDNPQVKFERRADGTIEYMALTGGETGRRNSDLLTDLTIWNRQSRAGAVFDSSTGFRLPSGAVRSPDAAWVSRAAWEALSDEQRRKFPPLCPEFLAELLSDPDGLAEADQKMQQYLAAGCRLAWLIVPKTQTARLYRPDREVREITGFAQTLSGEDVLPGFGFALSLLS